MKSVKHWFEYYNLMKHSTPFIIQYPICGGGEECITACPFGDKIWKVQLMNVSLFGFREEPRFRPVMANHSLCKGCQLCVQACPTGALRPKEKPIKHTFLTLLYNMLKLPFKKRFNIRFVLRKEHIEKFLKNNGFKS